MGEPKPPPDKDEIIKDVKAAVKDSAANPIESLEAAASFLDDVDDPPPSK